MSIAVKSLGFSTEPKSDVVPKARVSFALYYSATGRQVWAPLRYANAGFFYGEERHRKTLLKNLHKPNKEGRFCEVMHYSFNKEDAEEDNRSFKTMKVTSSFEGLLDALLAARGEILAHQVGSVEVNKTLQAVVLDLGPAELVQLKNYGILGKLIDLLTGSQAARMYVMVVAQLAKQVPQEVHDFLEFKAYLEDDNREIAFKIVGTKEYELYNVNREVVGLLKVKDNEAFVPVHDLAYRPSQYKIEKTKVAEIEEAAYADFLKNFPVR